MAASSRKKKDTAIAAYRNYGLRFKNCLTLSEVSYPESTDVTL